MNNNRFQPNRNMRFGRGPRHLFREKPKDTKGALKRLIKYLGGFKSFFITKVNCIGNFTLNNW